MLDLARFQRNFADVKHEVAPPIKVGQWDAPSGRPENWIPDPEEEELPSLNIHKDRLEWFNLNELETDQLLTLALRGAMYGVRRVNDDEMKLWCERGGINKRSVPFLGKLKNFGMVDMIDMETTEFYPQSIAVVGGDVKSHIVMPYFSFDEEGKLQPPTTVWRGSVQAIELGKI